MNSTEPNLIRDIAIVGAGSYASTIAELAESCGYRVVRFLDDDAVKHRSILDDKPVSYPIDQSLAELSRECAIAVAIGDNDARLRWITRSKELGHPIPALISPYAVVSPRATIHEGVYLHPGCHVWTHAQLAEGTILSPHATVAHHTRLGPACFVSTGANVGASIAVGESCMFGIGSTVSTGVASVGAHTLVGAGTVVIRDTVPYGIYAGTPARLLRVAQR